MIQQSVCVSPVWTGIALSKKLFLLLLLLFFPLFFFFSSKQANFFPSLCSPFFFFLSSFVLSKRDLNVYTGTTTTATATAGTILAYDSSLIVHDCLTEFDFEKVR